MSFLGLELETKTKDGYEFCVKGMIEQNEHLIHIVCQCYYVVALGIHEKKSFKTFANTFVHTLLSVYDRLKLKRGPKLRHVSAYNSIWCIIELDYKELVNVQAIVQKLQLRLVSGLPGVFGLELAQHTFPLRDNGNVYSLEGHFRQFEEMQVPTNKKTC